MILNGIETRNKRQEAKQETKLLKQETKDTLQTNDIKKSGK